MPFIKDVVIGIDGWYAWTVDDDVYYTKSSTPSIGDKVYNSNKEDSGYTVKEISANTIMIG